jgi:hypothetical protein
MPHTESLEQLSLTKGFTDYLWFSIEYYSSMTRTCRLTLENTKDMAHVFVQGDYVSTGKVSNFRVIQGTNYIDILLVDMGLPNYGSFIERNIKGLSGSIKLCDQNIKKYR